METKKSNSSPPVWRIPDKELAVYASAIYRRIYSKISIEAIKENTKRGNFPDWISFKSLFRETKRRAIEGEIGKEEFKKEIDLWLESHSYSLDLTGGIPDPEELSITPGKEYNGLKVLKPIGYRKNHMVWEVRCTRCGRVLECSPTKLLPSGQTDCGCSKKEREQRKQELKEYPFNIYIKVLGRVPIDFEDDPLSGRWAGVLTEKQLEICEDYYVYRKNLRVIAEERGVTRQATSCLKQGAIARLKQAE